jgi:hypothetical protein
MSSAEVRAEIRAQVTALNDLASRAVKECHQKCIPKPRDGELSIAEMACVDRCVPKFVATLDVISKELETARNGGVTVVPAK